jgi:hypothetical protein
VLTHKPIYRNQAFANGINGEKKAFESYGAQQSWPFRRNETLSRNFIAIQSQSCFGDRPDISLPARDHDPLRAAGFQIELFGQRSWHHGERRASVHKELNLFYAARRTSQVGFYVEQSHRTELIVAQRTNNATTRDKRRRQKIWRTSHDKIYSLLGTGDYPSDDSSTKADPSARLRMTQQMGTGRRRRLERLERLELLPLDFARGPELVKGEHAGTLTANGSAESANRKG